MSSSMTNKSLNKNIIKWIAVVVGTILTYILANGHEAINAQQTAFFAITIFYILITALELLPNMIIAVLLPFTYLIFNLAPSATIFSAWSNNVIWFTVCGILAANILTRIGLLKRLVFWGILKAGCSYKRIIFAFAVASVVLTLISADGSCFVMAAVAYTFCKTLQLEGTQTGKGLMLAATLMLGHGLYLFAPSTCLFIVSLANSVDPTVTMDYVSYFIHNAPFILITVIMYCLVPVLFKQDVDIQEEAVKKLASETGVMSSDEKKALIITVAFLILILTVNLHKISLLYLFVLFGTIFYFPGINIGTAEDIKSVNYSLVFFIAGFISIGSVASYIEINTVLSTILVPMLSGHSDTVIVAGMYVFAFLANIVMTPFAAIAALTIPVTQIAVDLGVGVYPALYAFLGGLCELILPYESALYLVFYAYGMFTFKDFMKLFSIRALLHLIFIVLIMMPYWGFLGLT